VSMNKRGKLQLNVGKEWQTLLFQMHQRDKRLYFEYRSRAEDEALPIRVLTAKYIAYDQVLRIEHGQSSRSDLPYQFMVTLRLKIDENQRWVCGRVYVLHSTCRLR
jgi:hypothetical protein